MRRAPADGARGIGHEPRVNAAPVEDVAALRQQPQRLGVFVVTQADGAAGGGALVGFELGVGVLWEGGDGGCVEAFVLDDYVDGSFAVVGGGVAAEGGGGGRLRFLAPV